MKKYIKSVLIACLVLGFTACNTEYLDPNSTLEPEVVSSTDNLIKLINGVQQRWSADKAGMVYNYTHISGLNTGELRLLNPGNLAENDIIIGGVNVNGGNDILNNLWTNGMLCRKEATTIIESADATTSDAATANSLKAYGLFYRALVHGTLIQVFEKIPVTIEENAAFVDKAGVLTNALADLNEAKGYVSAGLSATVTSGVITSVDLENSINALIARFSLMAGDYNGAITAADAVSLDAKSTWRYDAAVPNPLSFWFGSQNVTQAKDMSFTLPAALAPDAADARVTFYVTAADLTISAPDYQIAAFYDDNLDEIPVYLPGEMLLIKAEAYARLDDTANSISALDAVLTKTAAQDAFGVGAALPAYSGDETAAALLDEIYKNRRIELYLSGLGLEDSRRFNRPGPADANPERNRNYYPYPNAERDNNTSTPDNPNS